MKLYITGIAGMLGYGIAVSLKNRAEITGIDIIDIELKDVTYQRISLLDRAAVKANILKERPDILVHTAAMVNVDECEEKIELAEILNTEVTAELSDTCAAQGIKMIYISSDAVFDGMNARLYREDDEAKPINVYGSTKLRGEYAVLKYPDNLVLRTNIYGVNIQCKKSFGEWIYDSLKQDLTIRMFDDIDFSPILVTELAEVIYKACMEGLTGLYHACGTGCITKYEFGMKFKEIFNFQTGRIIKESSDYMNFKARRSKHMGMDNRKLSEALGITMSTPEESIYKFKKLIESRKLQ